MVIQALSFRISCSALYLVTAVAYDNIEIVRHTRKELYFYQVNWGKMDSVQQWSWFRTFSGRIWAIDLHLLTILFFASFCHFPVFLLLLAWTSPFENVNINPGTQIRVSKHEERLESAGRISDYSIFHFLFLWLAMFRFSYFYWFKPSLTKDEY